MSCVVPLYDILVKHDYVESISPEARLHLNKLGDPEEVFEVLMTIEQRFDVTVAEDVVLNCNKFEELTIYIDQLISESELKCR